MKHSIRVLFVAVPLALGGAAAAKSLAEKPAVPVIRISVEMIQVDAVVTDQKGRHVTDLSPADFAVFQDGKAQKLSHVTYHRTAMGGKNPGATSEGPGGQAPATVAPTVPANVVFVVDDLSLGPDGFHQMRRSLYQAMEAITSKDYIGIVSTAKGYKQLDLSRDRKANVAAVEALRRTPWTRSEIMSLGSAESTFNYLQNGWTRFDGSANEDWNARLAMQSLGVIKTTIRALQGVPGRKALILITEGFTGIPSFGREYVNSFAWPLDKLYGDASDLHGALKRLADLSARAGVVIHIVDPRGLMTGGIGAQQAVPQASGLEEQGRATRVLIQHSQDTLDWLAAETGGLAKFNTNDIPGAVAEVLDDLSGYYLIGYEPDARTFKSGTFHDIDLKVTRPGLKVRTRKGFYAVTDDQVAAALQ